MKYIEPVKIPKIKALGLKNTMDFGEDLENVLPTISFKVEPDIKVGEESLVQFIISGNTRWGKNNLSVQLLNENKELAFTTSNWTSVDYGFTIKTNITTKKAGRFVISFKVNNKITNNLVIESKYAILEEPKLVNDLKVNYSEEQKAKLITTVYGESSRDSNLCVNIPWIYYNLTKKGNFESRLSLSSHYKGRNDGKYTEETYKACMYYLGQGNQFADDKMVNGVKIKDFCKLTNKSFVDTYKFYLDIIRDHFNHYIFNAETVENPYYGWSGQGYYGDMNIREIGNDRDKWAKASQYFHLQNKRFVKHRFVKEFIARDPARKNIKGTKLDVTTYLCDDINIANFFKENPSELPEYEAGKCVSFKNRVLCNKNEKNAIPGVHFEIF